MKKLNLILAGALMISPAMFAQQSSTPADQSSATQSSSTSTQTSTQASTSGKASLTADQKAELKQLRTKVRTECKADKTSDSCKQAKADLKAKKSEYGMTAKHHKGHKGAAAQSTQNPS